MTDEPRVLRLSVSPALLRLMAECVLIRSNELGRLETVDRLAADLLAADPTILPDDVDSLRDHLTAMPSSGPVTLDLDLGSAENRALQSYQARAAGALERRVDETDALSGLLFGYLVDRKVRAAVAAIEAGSLQGTPGGASESPASDLRVVPFRR